MILCRVLKKFGKTYGKFRKVKKSQEKCLKKWVKFRQKLGVFAYKTGFYF
jgi:hypothetical protein